MQEISNFPDVRETEDRERLSPSVFLEHAASHDSPPSDLAVEIEALWWDAHGDTERALELLEEEPGLNAVWIRAYVRRKLGDQAIASFWYAKAGRPVARGSSGTERNLILKVVLGGASE